MIQRPTGDAGLVLGRVARAYRHANQLAVVVQNTIVRLERDFLTWGRERLRLRWPDVHYSAISTRPCPALPLGACRRGDASFLAGDPNRL